MVCTRAAFDAIALQNIQYLFYSILFQRWRRIYYFILLFRRTSQFFHFTGFAAIFFWQHFLWDEFIQGLKIAMEVDTLANLFFEEWSNEIDNRIN